jgi:hypothetical protein
MYLRIFWAEALLLVLAAMKEEGSKWFYWIFIYAVVLGRGSYGWWGGT